MSGKISCYIAALALISMLIAVFANAVFVKNTAEHILLLADYAENTATEQILYLAKIYNYWNESLPLLKISLSEEELDKISLAIDEATICAKNRDDEEYKRSMARLRRAIEGIKKREKFTLENIF
jgi:hypothetical protein